MTFASVVEAELARRRRTFWGWIQRLLFLLIVLLILVAAALAVYLPFKFSSSTPGYQDVESHFRFGSIGAEAPSGLPYQVWMALPHLFPEQFQNRTDYSTFGFVYDGERDLPVGIAERRQTGIDLVWFNCAVCHFGSYRETEDGPVNFVSGMPSNSLDLGRLTAMILDIADDPRMAPEPLMAAMQKAGVGLSWIDRQIWRVAVFPRLREVLLDQAARLQPLLDRQPAWGAGRVDTFNPYKVLQFEMQAPDLAEGEVVGASDFPSIFHQGPRQGMSLHWDGNNDSLRERNLSAAIGAGVTPQSVDHHSIRRIADWLRDLAPPKSPHKPDPESVKAGRALYMKNCAACHGYQGEDGYVFEGDKLGIVEPIDKIGTDPARLNSYTEAFSRLQKERLFAGTPYAFEHFTKTNGYANAPLDGLWLRGPFLHNGSVPTLAALLEAPEDRPVAFLRQSDVIDPNGGFVSPACEPEAPNCYDTRLPGNNNSGHAYGTDFAPGEKADLLAYLLTF